MARKRGKKALYEVMSKARNKPGYGRTLEKMRPKKPVPKQEEITNNSSKADVETSKTKAKWWRKPRVVQFNVGRVEFSMPYQLGVALVLIAILLVLAAFQLGRFYHSRDDSAIEPDETVTENIRSPIQENPTEQREIIKKTEPPAPVVEERVIPKTEELKPVEPATTKSTGNNVIVLVEFGARADLVPVQAHFAEYGIETEIVIENGRYFLRTKNRYVNPGTPGTDGNKALQEIIKIGAKYKGKAPPGYETFAPHFFSDAYGKKVR